MSKKYLLAVCGLIFLFGFRVARADLVINEIMYSPKSDAWIEIYNDSDSAVDLTQYKILDAGAAVNGHGIIASSGSNPVPAHSYAVVATSSAITKFGSVSWPVFKSALAPNTAGDTITLKLGSNIINTATFSSSQGAAGDGNSLGLVGGTWVVTVPTPGTVNQAFTSSNTDSDSGSGQNTDDPDADTTGNTDPVTNTADSSSVSGSGGGQISSATATSTASVNTNANSNSSKTPQANLTTEIRSKMLDFVGIPVAFTGSASLYAGVPLNYGKYFWNFGDGSSIDTQSADTLSHTYLYPGDYVVSMEYYLNSYSEVPDIVNKIKIKVVPISLSISSVGPSAQAGANADFFVELTNNSEYDMDISNWMLVSADKNFTLPRNSIILAKDTMTLSSSITHFTFDDKNNLELQSPAGQIISTYTDPIKDPLKNNPVVTASAIISTPPPVVLADEIPVKNKTENTEIKTEIKTEIPSPVLQNVSASVVSSGVIPQKSSHIYFLSSLLILFVGASAAGVYFIRRKSVTTEARNDFETLDE